MRMGYYIVRERRAVLASPRVVRGRHVDVAIPDKTFHTWLEMGFKTTFDF